MIKLDVAPYCQNCTKFRAATTEKRLVADSIVIITEFRVGCEHARECEAMASWIRKELENG